MAKETKKKARKKATPDPIETLAKELQKKLEDKRADLEEQYKRATNPDKKEILKLKICVIRDLLDDLDTHILNLPYTGPFKCPHP